MEHDLEYRMYGLVPYNISPIQQGIQYGHSLQEFNNAIIDYILSDSFSLEDENWKQFDSWRKLHKTFIILNGGTTNKQSDIVTGEPLGTLNQHALRLTENEVKIATFNEPDLNDALTAVVFLVDERVFDKKKYPDFKDWLEEQYTSGYITDEIKAYCAATGKRPDYDRVFPTTYKNWVDHVGGRQNVWLREFTSQFKLA